MRKKIETRKKFRRICALVVVGMFVAMTPMSVSAQPNPENWSKYGDVATDSDVLGTLNSEPLRIITNGMERIHVTSDGKVGIGTVDPIYVLHVRDFTPTIPEEGTTIAIESSVSSVTPGDPLGTILFMGSYEEGIWGTGAMIRAEASGPFIGIEPNISPTSLQFYTQDATPFNGLVTPRMVITDEGNVGIGTTKPGTTLHVKTYQADRHIRVEREDQFPYPEGTYMDLISGGAFCAIDCVETYDEVFQIQEDGTARLHIKKGGNVGIGTVSPNCRLHVVGDANITGSLYAGSLNVDSGALYIDDVNDRVGIGTMNPQYTLDVDGDIHASGTLSCGNSITIDGDNDKITASSGTIDFEDENLVTTGIITAQKLEISGKIVVGDDGTPPTAGAIRWNGANFQGYTGTEWKDLDVQATSGGGWTRDGGTEVVRLTTSSDKVGIGTTNPSTKLEVNGIITATGGNSDNWNTAYGWGDHASAGYITAVYADNGLTGGGTSGDVHLNVGAGIGISVSADTVALAPNYADGSAYDSRFVNEGQSNSITTGMIVDRAVDGTKIAIGSHVSGSVRFGPVFKVTNAETSNSDPVGIMGEVTGSHETVGVHGKAGDSGVWPAYGAGVWGESDNGPGVIGTSVSWHGVVGRSTSGYAGFFEGDAKVTNDLTVVGQIYKGKCNFKIDHPLDPANKYLIHTCVESSEMINLYNGVVELDEKGEAWVEFPEWFGTLNKDFRYQLTPIGAAGPGLYIAEEISGNRFKIAGGVPDMKVSWQVTGIRNDPFAENYPTIVEELKPEHERGKYLHPELYGMPENMAIGYIEHNLKDR